MKPHHVKNHIPWYIEVQKKVKKYLDINYPDRLLLWQDSSIMWLEDDRLYEQYSVMENEEQVIIQVIMLNRMNKKNSFQIFKLFHYGQVND